MIGNALRVMVIGGCVLAAIGSASAPKAHDVQRTASVPGNVDDTWAAVIDVFADYNIPIDKMDKASGFITTEWMRLPSDGTEWADCGSAPLASKGDTQVRFNVRVREEGDGASLTVNTSFRQPRSLGDAHNVVDCTSTGVFEGKMHDHVQGALAAHQRRSPKPAPVAVPAAAIVPAATAEAAQGSSAQLGSDAGSAALKSGQ